MSHWFASIAQAVYREYDRRIRRASLVTAYGLDHHDHEDHAEDQHPADRAPDEAGVIIANVPRGAEVPAATHTAVTAGPETPRDHLALDPPPPPAPAHTTAGEGSGEAEIVNTPPGAPAP
ncbi:MAG TPA: hypothetical protein VNL77_17980 [Roseiflexaceae bacterium]|nr:hypothetical protein [Roseiflexaceae bacterium]